MSISDDATVTESSGTVFADLGLPDPEEALAKAELARAISAIIAERQLTQARAAELLGIDQPKISALTRGRLTGFSIDRLLRFVVALDHDVEIAVRPKLQGSARCRVSVASSSLPDGERERNRH
jgi:predicted XRE-type DNA-binding protein